MTASAQQMYPTADWKAGRWYCDRQPRFALVAWFAAIAQISLNWADSKRRRILLDQKVNDIRDNQLKVRKEADEKISGTGSKTFHSNCRWQWYQAKRREKILRWLSPGDFDLNRQRDIRQKRAIGSGAWFFLTHEWNQWISGESQLFWCRGNGRQVASV